MNTPLPDTAYALLMGVPALIGLVLFVAFRLSDHNATRPRKPANNNQASKWQIN